MFRCSVPGTGQTVATGSRGTKNGASGGWADFAGLGFWISHMVLGVLSVEGRGVKEFW
jgi:hypothetical protein